MIENHNKDSVFVFAEIIVILNLLYYLLSTAHIVLLVHFPFA